MIMMICIKLFYVCMSHFRVTIFFMWRGINDYYYDKLAYDIFRNQDKPTLLEILYLIHCYICTRYLSYSYRFYLWQFRSIGISASRRTLWINL